MGPPPAIAAPAAETSVPHMMLRTMDWQTASNNVTCGIHSLLDHHCVLCCDTRDRERPCHDVGWANTCIDDTQIDNLGNWFALAVGGIALLASPRLGSEAGKVHCAAHLQGKAAVRV
jgi:hypothetical protein